MAVTSAVAYQQILSTALEDRQSGYQDLVSASTPLLDVLNRKGRWKTYSGPRIREVLQIGKPEGQWYSGFDFLKASPVELFNSAYFTPKQTVVPIVLSMEEILNNQGPNQIIPIMSRYMDIAENRLMEVMDEAVNGDGTADGGKQLTGLRAAVPTINTTGVYGGIDRATYATWRTGSYDANSFLSPYTQVNATSVRPMFDFIVRARTRGRSGPDLIIASPEHYSAYEASLMAIQRIDNVSNTGTNGFRRLLYTGVNRTIEVVYAGGIGSIFPANTTYFLDTDTLTMYYNPDRNFDKLFTGDGQMPLNQDAIVQFIGWMGELVMNNPLFNAKLYDSNPAA